MSDTESGARAPGIDRPTPPKRPYGATLDLLNEALTRLSCYMRDSAGGLPLDLRWPVGEGVVVFHPKDGLLFGYADGRSSPCLLRYAPLSVRVHVATNAAAYLADFDAALLKAVVDLEPALTNVGLVVEEVEARTEGRAPTKEAP